LVFQVFLAHVRNPPAKQFETNCFVPRVLSAWLRKCEPGHLAVRLCCSLRRPMPSARLRRGVHRAARAQLGPVSGRTILCRQLAKTPTTHRKCPG
jgi:hypothetical protein